MASRGLSTEEVVSIICGDTEVDSLESDCCSEDLISEEVTSASAARGRGSWNQQSRLYRRKR